MYEPWKPATGTARPLGWAFTSGPAPSLAQTVSAAVGTIGTFLFVESRLEARLGKKIDEQGARIDEQGARIDGLAR